MKTRADIAAVRFFVSLLTFSGLPDAIALPSVWLRPGPLKTAVVNRFHSDYPLYLRLMVYQRLDTPDGNHEVRFPEIKAESLCRFCFDVVDPFLRPLRIMKDRDRHSEFQDPDSFRSPRIFAKVACDSQRQLRTQARLLCANVVSFSARFCLLQMMMLRRARSSLLTHKRCWQAIAEGSFRETVWMCVWTERNNYVSKPRSRKISPVV
jgi:hypothetical protein